MKVWATFQTQFAGRCGCLCGWLCGGKTKETKNPLELLSLNLSDRLYSRHTSRFTRLFRIFIIPWKQISHRICHQRTEIRPAHMLNRLPTTAAKIHHILITELSGRDTETWGAGGRETERGRGAMSKCEGGACMHTATYTSAHTPAYMNSHCNKVILWPAQVNKVQ